MKGSSASMAATASAANSSSISASQPASAKPRALEIISHPRSIFAGESFETLVNVSVNTTFSVYSYVFSGSTPVSEWNGRRTWDANRVEMNATNGLLVLTVKIENGTMPGNYTVKVKAKAEKDYEASGIIEVLERPKLHVEKINSSYILSTSCTDCEIMIIGQDFEKTVHDSYFLNTTGTFNILLIKDSKIFSKDKINIESIRPKEGRTDKALPATGFAAKKSPGKINYIILAHLLAKIKIF